MSTEERIFILQITVIQYVFQMSKGYYPLLTSWVGELNKDDRTEVAILILVGEVVGREPLHMSLFV